ncbi:uncharacterized protein LOC125539823 isoform X2 [Triticum urartu]|uniref:uncharacterized protein LOC125539823 isoform X2 n=1 Tax=Triticum urartu TaxID=4572 RepID=UPI0020439047|nr:uncharacterized protein LOC125539823 isoform X2 [Triticum urartu]
MYHRSYFHPGYNSTDGSRSLQVGDHHDASLSAPSNLTVDSGTFEAQNEYDGSRSLRVGDHHDASLSAPSNLTLDCGTFVAQDARGCEPSNNEMDGAAKLQDDRTWEQHATGAVYNESKDYADKTREQFNAQRRAAYRKKKEDKVRL